MVTIGPIENNENPCCARCPQCCCEQMGCEYTPEDVIAQYGEISLPVVIRMIRTGDVMIDCYTDDDDNDTYLLRVRTVDDHFAVDMAHIAARCVALTETGCKFPWDKRPSGAKIVIPNPDDPGYGCTNAVPEICGKHSFAEMWKPYQDILLQGVDLFSDYIYSEHLDDAKQNGYSEHREQ